MSAHCPNCEALQKQLIEAWLDQVPDGEPIVCEPLDPNNYRERAAMIEAKRINDMPEAARHRAITDLILSNVNLDVNRVGFYARLAAFEGGWN